MSFCVQHKHCISSAAAVVTFYLVFEFSQSIDHNMDGWLKILGSFIKAADYMLHDNIY